MKKILIVFGIGFALVLEILSLIAGIAYIGHLYERNQYRFVPDTMEPYRLMEGTYWTTSKVGTVLSIKTMFLIETKTGQVKYLDEGKWYYTSSY